MENGDTDNLLSIKCRLGVGPKREKGMQVGTCAITHLFHSLPSFWLSFGFFNTKHKMLGMVWLGINPCGGTSASIFHLSLSLSNNRDEDGVFFCREEEALLPNEAGLLFSHMVPISAPSFISIINSLLYSNPPLLYQSLHMCPCEFWQLN